MVYHTDLGGSAVLSIFQPALVTYMLPTSTNSATKTHFWFIQHFCRDLRPWALVRLAHGSKLISKSRLLVEWTDKWQVPSCYGTSVPSAFFSLVLRSSPIMPAKLDTKKSLFQLPLHENLWKVWTKVGDMTNSPALWGWLGWLEWTFCNMISCGSSRPKLLAHGFNLTARISLNPGDGICATTDFCYPNLSHAVSATMPSTSTYVWLDNQHYKYISINTVHDKTNIHWSLHL